MAAARLIASSGTALALLGALFASPAFGHHSFAIYDADNPRMLEGVVDEFRWVNPHSMVRVRVANDDGSESIWQLDFNPVSYTHLRAHETYEGISFCVVCL